jgi:hypothetical protein
MKREERKKERKEGEKRSKKKKKTLFFVDFQSTYPLGYEYTVNYGRFLTECHFVPQVI